MMAAIPIGKHPFLYHPRWPDLDVNTIPMYVKQILEERDRELEDYLGTQSTSSGSASLPTISLSRSTNQTVSTTSFYTNFTATDWAETGAHAGTIGGAGAIVIDTPGRWWASTYALLNNDLSDENLSGNLGLYRGANVRVFYGPAIATSAQGPFALSFGFDCLANDIIFAGGLFSGGVSPGGHVLCSSTSPAVLQAFLVKAA